MGHDELKAFVEKVKTDEVLRKELMEVTKKKDFDAMITFLKGKGVSDTGIESLKKVQEAAATVEGGELSDEALAAVAGGGCWSNVGGRRNAGTRARSLTGRASLSHGG